EPEVAQVLVTIADFNLHVSSGPFFGLVVAKRLFDPAAPFVPDANLPFADRQFFHDDGPVLVADSQIGMLRNNQPSGKPGVNGAVDVNGISLRSWKRTSEARSHRY